MPLRGELTTSPPRQALTSIPWNVSAFEPLTSGYRVSAHMGKNRTRRGVVTCLAAGILAAAACSQQSTPPSKADPAAAATAPPDAALPPDPRLEQINSARFTAEAEAAKTATAAESNDVTAEAAGAGTYAPMLVKAQVLLDRARFSPGVIDGKDGTNLHHAILSFQSARGLPVSGDLDEATWATLTADARPVAETYQLTAADVSGPFSPDVGEDLVKMAALTSQGYTRATEGLAERFHMDEDLLKALNPEVDFRKPGVNIVVLRRARRPSPRVMWTTSRSPSRANRSQRSTILARFWRYIRQRWARVNARHRAAFTRSRASLTSRTTPTIPRSSPGVLALTESC